jgi:peptidoglycan hydrolase CwlO-like protein
MPGPQCAENEKNTIMKLTHSLLAIFMAASSLMAQETIDADASLKNQFDELKSKSNNYQIYKVVKETSLDEFWKSVRDTINADRTNITDLQKEMASLKAEVQSLNAQVAERDEKLEEQVYQIEHMSFLGIGLTKGTYIVFTWVLIFALLIAALVLYFRFQSANRITQQTRKEYQTLQSEFDEHRQRTRENETKLKRDLQTEINRVEELKGKSGSGS